MTAAKIVRSAILSLALELAAPRAEPDAVVAEIRVRPLDWEGLIALQSAAYVAAAAITFPAPALVAYGQREGAVRVRVGVPSSSDGGGGRHPVPTRESIEAQLLVALQSSAPILRAHGYRVSIREDADPPGPPERVLRKEALDAR